MSLVCDMLSHVNMTYRTR